MNIEEANRLKDLGNKSFAAKNYEDSLKYYN